MSGQKPNYKSAGKHSKKHAGRSTDSSVSKYAQVILYRLNQSGGFIPCHDKSSPEEIRKRFSMSKKEFKRAVGNLYKKRVIELKNNGIGLVK